MSGNPPPVNLGALPPQNFVDRAISYLWPKAGLDRLRARAMLSLAGGYTGARRDKAQLSRWNPRGGSPDSDLIPDLPALRQRSRDLSRNEAVATGAIGTTVSHVVGTGLSCNPQAVASLLGLSKEQASAWNADVKTRFCAWAASKDCDLSRGMTFYGLQALAFRAVVESGDAFVLTPMQKREIGGPELALQVVEGDLVCNPRGMSDSATLTEGIEHDATTGEAVLVHIATRHPGDVSRAPLDWKQVRVRGSTGRKAVIHLFRGTRPGQRRGAPLLAPIIEPLKQLGRYTEAELNAAVTSGLFAVFMKMDPQAFQDLFEQDDQDRYVDRSMKWSGEIESGKAVNLLPGEEPVTSNPGRPNSQFDPFVQSILVQIGMALGIPFEVLTQRFNSSYTAAKGALLQAWRFFMGWRDWLATNLCQEVYLVWLSHEVAAGRIRAPGFFASPLLRHAWSACLWVGDGPGSIDPTREVEAAEKRIALGISTGEAESILHDGVDWETKHARLVEEAAARKAAGFMMPGEAPPPPAAPQPPAADPDPNTQAVIAAQAQSTAALVAALANQQPVIVNNGAPVVNQGDTHVHMPEGMVQMTLEATMPPVSVPVAVQTGEQHNHIDLQPQTLVVQQPRGAMRQVITETDENGDAKVIETYPIQKD